MAGKLNARTDFVVNMIYMLSYCSYLIKFNCFSFVIKSREKLVSTRMFKYIFLTDQMSKFYNNTISLHNFYRSFEKDVGAESVYKKAH